MSSHVSDIQFDRFVSGELSARAERKIELHCQRCTPCGARYHGVREVQQRFEHAALPVWLLAMQASSAATPDRRNVVTREPATRAWWTRALSGYRAWLAGGVGASIVVMAGVLIWARADASVVTRRKGSGVTLAVYCERAGDVREVSNGDLVVVGDRIQAVYTSAENGYGAVISRDGSGTVATYVPAVGRTMVALPLGEGMSFPISTELDETVGDEHLLVVWCKQPRALEAWERVLREPAVAEVAGCTSRAWTLRKGAP